MSIPARRIVILAADDYKEFENRPWCEVFSIANGCNGSLRSGGSTDKDAKVKALTKRRVPADADEEDTTRLVTLESDIPTEIQCSKRRFTIAFHCAALL